MHSATAEVAGEWHALFEGWPAGLPRQGLLTTTHQESVPFADFRYTNGLLIVERDRPDALGARKVIIPFGTIASLKLSDPGELSRYQVLGFSRMGG